VLEGPHDGVRPGSLVAFLAPCAPTCAERLVMPGALVGALDPGVRVPGLREDEVRLRRETPAPPAEGEPPWWNAVRGHSFYAGHSIDLHAAALLRKEALRTILASNWIRAERHEVPLTLPYELSQPTRSAPSKRPNAVLFGYGNYAKTVMLPGVRRHLSVDGIHEVDPTQMPLRRSNTVRWDTSPTPRADESADAFLIAGYHHTHAPLAVDALRRGAAAVIEKPVATTRGQLRELLAALEETGGRVFSCFQRRYMQFNDLARGHLRTAPGDPINYHCIAYEVPNPELHWYRWPNSGSRLVSNGCHWLDHFLYLNAWSPVQSRQVASSPDGTLNCSVTLSNGACFTMVLTDAGSKRTGMQDHVELRANGVTVRIQNTARYHAEDGARTLGRARTTRLDSYRRMYESIAESIVRDEPGDSRLAVQASTQLVLNLEEDLQRQPVERGSALFEGLRVAAA